MKDGIMISLVEHGSIWISFHTICSLSKFHMRAAWALVARDCDTAMYLANKTHECP